MVHIAQVCIVEDIPISCNSKIIAPFFKVPTTTRLPLYKHHHHHYIVKCVFSSSPHQSSSLPGAIKIASFLATYDNLGRVKRSHIGSRQPCFVVQIGSAVCRCAPLFLLRRRSRYIFRGDWKCFAWQTGQQHRRNMLMRHTWSFSLVPTVSFMQIFSTKARFKILHRRLSSIEMGRVLIKQALLPQTFLGQDCSSTSAGLCSH